MHRKRLLRQPQAFSGDAPLSPKTGNVFGEADEGEAGFGMGAYIPDFFTSPSGIEKRVRMDKLCPDHVRGYPKLCNGTASGSVCSEQKGVLKKLVLEITIHYLITKNLVLSFSFFFSLLRSELFYILEFSCSRKQGCMPRLWNR